MKITVNISTSNIYNGYRVLHYAEGGYEHKLGYPAIHPSVNASPIIFTESMQYLSYNVMKKVSPSITPQQWTRVYDNGTALTNEQGFGNALPRRNYITRESLTSVDSNGQPALPKLMKAIIFAGTFIHGEKVGNVLRCVPGVHGVDATKSMPAVDTVLRNDWFTYAVSADSQAATHFIANTLTPVVYFLKEVVEYPIEWFVPWNENFLPDPLRFYL